MDKNEFKARVSMAFDGIPTWEDFLEKCWQVHNEELTQHGWHPASELPPVNEYLISELVLCWCVDSTFHTLEPKLGRVWRGEWCLKDVKWWCYPPKEE